MCLYPKQVLNPKYLPNRKNKGYPPPLTDIRLKYVTAECGNCRPCRRKKSNSWKTRLMEEIRIMHNGKMITFTIEDESYNYLKDIVISERNKEINSISNTLKRDIENTVKPLQGYELENAIIKLAFDMFKDRYRKKYGKTLRYWYTTELGQTNTERIHIHGIIWTDKPLNEIRELYKYGFVNKMNETWKGNFVSDRTINYMMKYVMKIDNLHKAYKPIIKASSKPGIGLNYLNRQDSHRNKFKGDKTEETYITRKGFKTAMPKYLKDKIYNDDEREQLQINKLDTGKVWIDGTQVNADTESEEHKGILKIKRDLNRMLGYGKRLTDEEIKEDEKRRELRKLRRIKKTIDNKSKFKDNRDTRDAS